MSFHSEIISTEISDLLEQIIFLKSFYSVLSTCIFVYFLFVFVDDEARLKRDILF